jgi:spore germination protein GerM
MPRRALPALAIVAITALGAWLLFIALPRWAGPAPGVAGGTAVAPAAAPGAERRITATLYFIAEDGMSLVGVQREVPYDEPVAEQARRIVEAQLSAPPDPLARAVPDGTTVRGLYLTDRGDAFVDLSDEARVRHRGGALDELFTVYAIVNAVTVNLPAVARVQILVNGREVDTLAGHVDLRHPLEKNLTWIATERAPETEDDAEKDDR